MRKVTVMLFVMVFIAAGWTYAVDEQTSLGTQAGEAARELKGTADETLSTGAAKVAESSQKIQTEAQEAFKTLQQQWDVFAKQLQEKTQKIQQQLQQQWQDFSQSFNQPSKQ